MGVTMKLLFIWLLSSALFYIVITVMVKRRHMKRRINTFLSFAAAEHETPEQLRSSVQLVISFISKIFYGISFVKTEKKLQQAGSILRPEEFWAWRIIIAVGIGFFSFLFESSLYIAAGTVALGFFLPSFYMERKRRKRLHILSYQLIETLGIMANSMRAGFSFMQAMQLAGKEMPDPLGPEFERVIRDIGLGVSVEEALHSLVARLPNRELDVVVQAILAQRMSGGNLAELLETMEETIRIRIRIMEELHTLTAQGRLSSWIVTLLPVGLALYLYVVSPNYFQPMLEHPLGWIMIFMAVSSIIIGWFIIQRVTRIEV